MKMMIVVNNTLDNLITTIYDKIFKEKELSQTINKDVVNIHNFCKEIKEKDVYLKDLHDVLVYYLKKSHLIVIYLLII